MLQVEMTDDIRRYQTKFLGPFTMRQTICIGIAAIVGIPLAIFIKCDDISTKIIIICAILAPIILCGYIKLDGCYFETLAIRYLYVTVLAPASRKQKSHNTFAQTLEALEKEQERKKIAQMSKKEAKKYMKVKNNKTIRYYNNDKDKSLKIYK